MNCMSQYARVGVGMSHNGYTYINSTSVGVGWSHTYAQIQIYIQLFKKSSSQCDTWIICNARQFT